MADSDKKLVEKAAKVILGTEAVSRFTKTPIKIIDYGKVMQTMETIRDKLPGTRIEGTPIDYNKPSGGMFTLKENPSDKITPKIEAISYAKEPSYPDIVGTIHHEDIHALLEKAGFKYPEVWDYPVGLQDLVMPSPVHKATQAFISGNRAGNYAVELPAYVGAFKPKELPGFTESDRKDYLNRLYQTMQPNLAQQLMRIISSYNASQQPPLSEPLYK